jgi:hypothetical protein
MAGALIQTNSVNAVAMGAFMPLTVIGVDVTLLAFPPARAAALVVVHQVYAFSVVAAGEAIHDTFVDICLAIDTLPPGEAQANIGGDTVLAGTTMATWG